uniref:Uncharacterized protein n=1 Tax=Ascaris lumbricoides TaxID=6252 RepID=A0A9J2PH98_ASCLU
MPVSAALLTYECKHNLWFRCSEKKSDSFMLKEIKWSVCQVQLTSAQKRTSTYKEYGT